MENNRMPKVDVPEVNYNYTVRSGGSYPVVFPFMNSDVQ